MKKLALILAVLYLLGKPAFNQILNGDFENWQTTDYYEFPNEWFIFDDIDLVNSLAEKVSDGQEGNYSVKLNTISDNDETLMALVSYGFPAEDGFIPAPFSQLADSLHFWVKANIEPGDAAWMVVVMFSGGNQIDSISYIINTSYISWTHIALPVNPLQIQPDSIFIGFISSKPDFFGGNPSPGTWLMVDNVYFTLGNNPAPITLPNFSFEDWSTVSVEDPVSWSSSNADYYLFINNTVNVSKTTDSWSGTYAAKLSPVELSGHLMKAELYYRQPFPGQPGELSFHYKFLPNGFDTAYANFNFFKNNNHVGGLFYLIADPELTYQNVSINFWLMDDPDEIEIEIFGGENPGTHLYIDDFRFSCQKPQQLFGHFISSTSAHTSWTPGGNETQWEIEWGLAGFTNGTGSTAVINNIPEYTITGISNTSHYDFYVRSLCSIGDDSDWAGPFTICNAFNASVFEDFESVPTGSLPQCWHSIAGFPSQVEVRDWGYIHNGMKYLNMLAHQYEPALLISPAIEENLSEVSVSFYGAKPGWSNAVIEVGTMSNPLDMSTFNHQSSFFLSDWYEPFMHSFNAYMGPDKYIAFMLHTNDPADEAFLDDIVIEKIPTCHQPWNLSVYNVTINSAQVVWQPGSTEANWNLNYGFAGFDPWSQGTPVYGLSAPFYDFGNSLNSGTYYEVYVQADCGGGDLSQWSGPIGFSTLCNIFTDPFTENFDNTPPYTMPPCWSQINTHNSSGFIGVHYMYPYSHPHHLVMWNGNVPDPAAEFMIVTPQISNISLNQVRFFAAANDNNVILQVGTISHPNNFGSFELITGLNLDFGYQEFEVPFSGYAGPNQYIAFRHGNPGAGNESMIFFDDFAYEPIPSCPKPFGLDAQNITTSSADLAWTPGDAESNWEVEIGWPGFMPGDGSAIETHTVSTPLLALSMLSSATTYQYYVRAVCGPGDISSWSPPQWFTTLCEVVSMPFTENFDAAPLYDMPNCWSRINTHSSSGFVGVHNFEVPNSHPHHLLMWNGDVPDPGAEFMSVTPELANPEMHQVRFFGKSNNTEAPLQVGMISNPYDPLTFYLIETILLTASYTEYIVPFNSYSGSAKYIALRHGTPGLGDQAIVFIDDFSYEPLETCPRPSNLTSSNTGPGSVILEWVEPGDALQWQIEWGNHYFSLGSGTNIHVTQTSYSINDLVPGNLYDFYVRSICGVGDTSLWAGPYMFYSPFQCDPDAVYGQNPDPIQNFLWSAQELDYKVHQSFSNISSVFDGLHVWGLKIFNDSGTPFDCFSDPIDLEIGLYTDNNGNIGDPVTTFVVQASPDSTHTESFGFQIYEYTIQFPQVIEMTDGWFSIRSVNSPTCHALFANTSNPQAHGFVHRVQGNDTTVFPPLGYCLLNNSLEVTYLAGDNGSIAGQTHQYVISGGDTDLVLAVADPCYEFISWSDGVTDNPRTDINVAANITVTASFGLIDMVYYDDAEICEGETYPWFGTDLSTTGTYYHTFSTPLGCDSVFMLNLTVNPVHEIFESHEMCEGDIYTWRGDDYELAGMYYDSLKTMAGCDSVYVLQVVINPVYEFVHTEEICHGDVFTWQGDDYVNPGTYYKNFASQHGCDSIYVLNLMVQPVYEFEQEHAMCEGDVFEWFGSNYTQGGTYYEDFSTQHGCDSVYVLNLTVHPVYEFIETGDICEGDFYTWRGNDYAVPGTYYYNLFSQFGCDSIYILNLSVHPNFEFIHTEEICDGVVYTWQGNDYTDPGTYYENYTSQFGCDSIYVLHLSVHTVYEFTEDVEICDGEVFVWRGNEYTTEGTYYDYLTTGAGCDSTYVLNLMVHELPEIIISGLDDFYCDDDDAVTLTGMPEGGVFSGNGVTGNLFDPANAGIGIWEIVYTYTDDNGCANFGIVTVEVDICSGANEPDHLPASVFPNPTGGVFTVELGRACSDVYMEISDFTGNLIQTAAYGETHRIEGTLDHLPTGVYFITVRSNEGVFRQKLIRKR